MMASSRDRLMVLTAAILFSTGGAVVKATTLNAWQVACFRSAVAALAIWIILPQARKLPSRSTFLVGAAYAVTMICFVFANKLTTAANAIFLQGTAPLYVMALSPWLLGERIRSRQLVFMAAIAIGMTFFFVGNQTASAIASNPSVGNLFAAASGLSYALLIIGLRHIGTGSGDSGATIAAVCFGNFLAAVVCGPMAFPVVSATVIDWTSILFLGLFQIAIAYVCLTRGITRVPALDVSLILIAEPVLSPFWTWLVHGETPTVWAFLGGAIILGVTVAMTLSRKEASS